MVEKGRYELRLNVSLNDRQGQDRLEISEMYVLDVDGFLEVCKVLGEFHELAQRLKRERTT